MVSTPVEALIVMLELADPSKEKRRVPEPPVAEKDPVNARPCVVARVVGPLTVIGTLMTTEIFAVAVPPRESTTVTTSL